MRGSSSHGWGAKKKHRGAGHRGGRGNAGSGKRGDAKKPSYWRDTKRVGKSGFTSKSALITKTITVQDLDRSAERLLLQKKATREGKAIVIDLLALGYHKLLGTGTTSKQFSLSIEQATPRAVEKINACGGSVTLLTGTADEASVEDVKEPTKK